VILNRTASLMEKMDRVLDERSVDHMHNTIANLDNFSYKLDAMMPKIDAFVTQSMAWETKMGDSFVSIKDTYSGMVLIMEDMASSFAAVQKDVESVSLNVVPTINNTMFTMQNTLIEFNSLLQEYKRSPNDLLFKKEEEKRGPGEK
jgi:phospholipid/cholesterol/gamma-HCH transport system substrate-binding protein